ncbi:L-rhamnose mutarotase [Aliiglaciecola lipolytica]|uniref:L-rhamnose mutarotase n=1 Tax=Aliiglaciecola lipolytica E3 TaxID=1127673 RepID=K6YJW8_9ALTE|nr:L-rhamnose mutarotase [Aliiglaciecola lipolytica]GAC16898.1 L-rhamnose mutarotase [Aliiglaciecola lipolytica E3]
MSDKPNRYCFALDLKDDPELIARYKQYHQPDNIWPEITDSIRRSGITAMDIFLTGNRLFMIMQVNDDFSFELMEQVNNSTPRSGEWEELMWTFQQALPWAKPNEKWLLMEQIFSLPSTS